MGERSVPQLSTTVATTLTVPTTAKINSAAPVLVKPFPKAEAPLVAIPLKSESGTSMTVGSKTFTALGVVLELEQEEDAGVVTIRLTGPSDVWFGVGFGALTMGERPYA